MGIVVKELTIKKLIVPLEHTIFTPSSNNFWRGFFRISVLPFFLQFVAVGIAVDDLLAELAFLAAHEIGHHQVIAGGQFHVEDADGEGGLHAVLVDVGNLNGRVGKDELLSDTWSGSCQQLSY